MNFPKTTWVVTEKARLGRRSLSSLLGCPDPAVTWGPSPGLRSVWETSLLAGAVTLLFGKGWAVKAISRILSVFLLFSFFQNCALDVTGTSIENDKIRVRIQFFKDMGVKILEFKVHFKAYGVPWIIGIV